MHLVCTVISRQGTDSGYHERLESLFKEHNLAVESSKVLNNHVRDIYLTGESTGSLQNQIKALCTKYTVDIILQPIKNRQKKLVVFDMDSTLIQNECIDMIAAYAGVESKVAAITEAAMRGELDFSQSLAQRVGLLKGVPVTVYDDLKQKITVTPGAQDLCRALRANNVKMAVLSGGFIPLANWIREKLGLDYAYANTLEESEKKLTGKTIGRIVDGNMKAQLLQEIAEKEKVPLDEVVAVGDGSNDLPMMAKAGFGIAFCAKPMVQEKAPSRLNTGDLSDILYVLGYSS